VIVVALAAIALVGLVWWHTKRAADRATARAAKRAELVARADRQHAWVLASDDRGVYGEYVPSTW